MTTGASFSTGRNTPGLAQQTSLSAPSSSALCLQNLQDASQVGAERGEGLRGPPGMGPRWLLSSHCPPRTRWPLLPQGQARFKPQKPEAAEMETWTR